MTRHTWSTCPRGGRSIHLPLVHPCWAANDASTSNAARFCSLVVLACLVLEELRTKGWQIVMACWTRSCLGTNGCSGGSGGGGVPWAVESLPVALRGGVEFPTATGGRGEESPATHKSGGVSMEHQSSEKAVGSRGDKD